jgi:hypothetical protein
VRNVEKRAESPGGNGLGTRKEAAFNAV